MVENKQLLEDAKFLQDSGALVKVFEDGDTLRIFDMYTRLGDLVRDHLPEERVMPAMGYLEEQGVFRTSSMYAIYQPVK